MIFAETFAIMIALLTGIVSSYLAFNESKKSPILEMRILAFSIFFATTFFVLSLPIALLSNSGEQLNQTWVLFAKIAYVFPGFAILGWQLVFFLPNMKFKYSKLFELIFIVIIDMSFVFVNVYTLDIVWNEKQTLLLFKFSTLGLLSMIFSIGSIGYVVFFRLKDISQLVDDQARPKFSILFLVGFGVSMMMAIVLAAGVPLYPDANIPQYSFGIPMGIIFFLFIYGSIKNKKFIFLIPVSPIALVISKQDSGIALYSKSFVDDAPADQLLAGLFTALNVSLKDAVKSTSDLEILAFGDKSVKLSPGNLVTTAFITSKNTLMVNHITNYITRQFEIEFHEILKSSSLESVNVNQYLTFDILVEEIKTYFAPHN